MNRDELDEVERLIDQHGIEDLIEAIVDVCYEKEEHVRMNWQDHRLADAWRKIASVLERANERISKIEIPL